MRRSKLASPSWWCGPLMPRILSNDLRDTLLRSGRIEPYRRTYAKRMPKVSAQLSTQPVEPVSLEALTRRVRSSREEYPASLV